MYMLYLKHQLKTVNMVNINTLKHYGKLGHNQKWNKTTIQLKKIQLLNLINDFEQVFPMGTAAK